MTRHRGRRARGARRGCRWFVCGMDQGVLRIEPSYADARRWVLDRHLTNRVLRREKYADGDYQLFVGDTSDEGSPGEFIVREDRLTGPTAGWDPEQQPLYPLTDHPHELVDRHPDPAQEDPS